MEDQTLMEEKPVNKNRTLMIAAIVVVVLCCCCVVVAAGGYYFYTSNKSVAVSPSLPEEVVAPQPYSGADEPPSGGLANDILKNDTWQVMGPAAVSLGCDQPSGAGLDIEVLQQPDAGGVWVEKWPVMCASGETYDFEVEFILDDTGATFNIKLMQ